MNSGQLVVFSAASGAGKSTILTALQESVPALVYSISATTRAPRDGEVDGVDYFFMDRLSFQKKADANGFVEWAEVHGNFYGTPRDFIDSSLADGKTVVMDIDVQGKALLDGLYPNAKGVFIEAPSEAELERRLRSRGTDSEETILLRLENARKEQEFARFQGKYEYFIVNDDLHGAVEKIARIIKLSGE